MKCTRPPQGYECTRPNGHSGACATIHNVGKEPEAAQVTPPEQFPKLFGLVFVAISLGIRVDFSHRYPHSMNAMCIGLHCGNIHIEKLLSLHSATLAQTTLLFEAGLEEMKLEIVRNRAASKPA